MELLVHHLTASLAWLRRWNFEPPSLLLRSLQLSQVDAHLLPVADFPQRAAFRKTPRSSYLSPLCTINYFRGRVRLKRETIRGSNDNIEPREES